MLTGPPYISRTLSTRRSNLPLIHCRSASVSFGHSRLRKSLVRGQFFSMKLGVVPIGDQGISVFCVGDHWPVADQQGRYPSTGGHTGCSVLQPQRSEEHTSELQ